jgi:predicted permease
MTLGEIWRRLRFFLHRDRFNAELEEEMRLHTELRSAALQGKAVDPPHAELLGRRQFGNTTSLVEESRDIWTISWLEEALQDIRFAIRQMYRAPSFTSVAVLSLALGIGANTAILTMIESVLLRPIAVKDAAQLRLLTWRSEESRQGWMAPSFGYRSPTYGWMYEQRPTADGALIHAEFSPPFYRQFLTGNAVFESLFGFKELGRVTAVVDHSAEPVNTFLVSGTFYRGMQVSPVIGRVIGPEDDVYSPGGSVAVISYEYWTRRFARSPTVIGKTITLNSVPVTIVGVNPKYFTGIVPGGHFEIWAPLHLPPSVYGPSLLDDDSAWRIQMMGRLRSGVSDAQAQTALDLLFQQTLDAEYLGGPFGSKLKDSAMRPHLRLIPGARGVDYVTDHYGRMLFVVLALAGLVLLIACANVANLLLVKSAARQREISLRLSLGASRARIVRQLIAEGLPLVGIAGLVGLFIGYSARNGIPALLARPWRPNPFETTFDSNVLLASLGITLVTGVLFSLAPAWQSRRVELNEALKDGSRGTMGASKLRLGSALVAFQVALSVVLLAGAGMCVKTFTNLRAVKFGIQPKGLLLFSLEPPRASYPENQIGPLLTRLQRAIHEIPGVQSATFADNGGGAYIGVGHRQPETKFASHAPAMGVGSQFFETMGIPILYGRAIDEPDHVNGPQAVVVNREFARHFFNRENAVGMTFLGLDGSGGSDRTPKSPEAVLYQVVGVCADWHLDWLRDPVRASFYSALPQASLASRVNFKVRISGDEAGVAKKLREIVRFVDPGLTVLDMRTQAAEIENSLSQERLMASLATVFGALALALASIGIYGVMAYSVARRTNEIGIRVALGARPQAVSWMVLRETLLLAVGGITIGVPAAIAISPVLDRALASGGTSSFAYGLKPHDPAMMAVAVFVLAAVAFVAGYLPARRAARVDPMVALRHD